MPSAPQWTPQEDERLVDVVRAGHAAGRAPELAGLRRTPAACVTRMTYLRRSGRDVPALPRAGGWTEQEVERLIAMYQNAATLQQIGEEFGRTIGAVHDEIRRQQNAGVKLPQRRPRWTQERRRHLAKLKRQGVSLTALEEEFGLTRGTITYQLRTLRRDGLLPPLDPPHSAPGRGRAS